MSGRSWSHREVSVLRKLYSERTAEEIAEELGRSKWSVYHKANRLGLKSYNQSQDSKEVSQDSESKFENQQLRIVLPVSSRDEIEKLEVDYSHPSSAVNVNLPLPVLTGQGKKKSTITIAVSDLHLGHSTHLPDTFWSTVSNLQAAIEEISQFVDIEAVYLVLNGDTVSGKGVYRMQQFDNWLQRGHQQVFLAVTVINQMVSKLEDTVGTEVTRLYILRGTHEKQNENYAMLIEKNKHLQVDGVYVGRKHLFNVADPVGHYNIFFTHGHGYSDYSPVSPSMTREIWGYMIQEKQPVERVCLGHTHLLTAGLWKKGVTFDVTGGFQKYEPKTTSRPCGCLLYLFCEDCGMSVSKITPDPQVEEREVHLRNLEYKNILYIARQLDVQWAEEKVVTPEMKSAKEVC